jgi:DNA-binding beta-propeller fold protein YncE
MPISGRLWPAILSLLLAPLVVGACWAALPGSGSSSSEALAGMATPAATGDRAGVGVVAQLALPGQPDWTTYDPVTDSIFVYILPAEGSSQAEIERISGANDTVVGSVLLPVGTEPPALDLAAQELFVPVFLSGFMVLSTLTLSSIGNISTNQSVGTPTVDPVNGLVYAPGGSGIVVMSPQTMRVVTVIPVGGGGPISVALDSSNNHLYAPTTTDGIVVVSGSTNTVVGRIPLNDVTNLFVLPVGPSSQLFGSNSSCASCDVSVYDGASDQLITQIGSSCLASTPMYDPANGLVYIGNSCSGLEAYSPTTDSVVARLSLGEMTRTPILDNVSGDLFVPNEDSSNASVVSGATDTAVANVSLPGFPIGGTFDGANGEVYIMGALNDSLTAIAGGGPDLLRVTETGLPKGSLWSVEVAGIRQWSETGRIEFPVFNGTLPFAVEPLSGYRSSPNSGNVTVQSPTQNLTVVFAGTGPAWWVLPLEVGALTVAAVAVGTVLVVWRRRRVARKHPAEPRDYL